MSDCCQAIQSQFDADYARTERERLERDGPIATTRALIDVVAGAGVDGSTVLDIGGGHGAVTEALLRAGATRATHVEASAAQSQEAREYFGTTPLDGRVSFHVGDFVELAPALQPADVVVLDRVICCYPDAQALLNASTGRARRLWAAVYPRDRVPVRVVLALENLWHGIRRRAFRAYVHPVAPMHARLRELGFRMRKIERTFAWEVALFERVP